MLFEQDRIEIITARKKTQVEEFLKVRGLTLESDIELTIGLFRDKTLIGTGSIAGNIIKCVAVSCKVTGEGIGLKLVSELVNHAYSMGRRKLYVYTKPQYRPIFSGAGFSPLAEVPETVTLLENSSSRLATYIKELEQYRKTGTNIAGIVMNANPFTLGHRYLVEKACQENDWVHLFVVKEDASEFSYDVRLRLILDGLEHLHNVTVHEGSDYIISKVTFPTYFIKDKQIVEDAHARLDLTLFRNHIAPALGINRRYVGSEPFCIVTSHYNRVMKEVFDDSALPCPVIEVKEVRRHEQSGHAVSASRVRELIGSVELDKLSALVPASTLSYINKEHVSKGHTNKGHTNKVYPANPFYTMN
ncbi:[citrate (pro-3S)-lyase] ligase [Endozoicomonas gorgoniicola]|uniref:[Citrate [pro-3S]-lyase] ligase n=1 Tax=Endozoicomonas gorgoniicola TaxID=1234144 RepID=A0ABT3N0B9_9GAMM|nr:[citrate (pro-3S)-lyase] ligase [Endozoicomonas gorgoniicola]MCW7554684.1 [citrate (pro-3S)-lyase] ligase [Endozoicomonas gorgoniicola]